MLQLWNIIEKIQKDKERLLFLPIHLLTMFFLLPDVPRFLLSIGRNSLNHSFRIGLLVMVLLVFLHLGISWNPLHSWRIFSLDMELWIYSSFFFQYLKSVVPFYSGFHGLCWEICYYLNCFSPIGNLVFFSHCFQN